MKKHKHSYMDYMLGSQVCRICGENRYHLDKNYRLLENKKHKKRMSLFGRSSVPKSFDELYSRKFIFGEKK